MQEKELYTGIWLDDGSQQIFTSEFTIDPKFVPSSVEVPSHTDVPPNQMLEVSRDTPHTLREIPLQSEQPVCI